MNYFVPQNDIPNFPHCVIYCVQENTVCHFCTTITTKVLKMLLRRVFLIFIDKYLWNRLIIDSSHRFTELEKLK